MKKLLVLLILLLFCTTIQGADVLEVFQQYRHGIRQSLGLDTASAAISDTTLNEYVRRAVFQIIPLLKPRLIEDLIVTTANNNIYSLDTLTIGVSSVQWRRKDSAKSLIYAPREIWYQLSVNPNLASEENLYNQRPSYYDYADSQIFLYPIPTIASDTFYIMSWYKLPTAFEKDSLFQIPVQYRLAVLGYATYLAGRSRQHPLTEIFYRDYQEIVAILKQAYPREYRPQLHPDSGYFER